ncbi:hypothetical protein [Streptomyces sp. NPDC012510]|uniref:hypothetical protein n=1 Tax=Streptomyces sp. NPDC012510 TaxID=3364838 RepID=UPI0036EFE812
MHGFKKIMLVTTAISSIGLAGSGVAQAHDAGDDQPADAAIENAQFLNCEQRFTSNALIEVNAPVSVFGDSITNIGNFCTQVAQGAGNG